MLLLTRLDRGSEPSLDAKLMTAIIKAAEKKNDVLLQLINKASREQRKAENIPLRGRQALWMIKRYFAADKTDKKLFDVDMLREHKYTGDDDMEKWKLHWDELDEGQEDPAPEEMKETCSTATFAIRRP